MPVCQNCEKVWSYEQTIRTLFKLKCPHCGAKQFESASSRRRSSFLGLAPLILLPFVTGMDFSVFMALILVVVLTSITLCFYPFVLKLSNEQEPFW
ncbi:cxxc_20_cxxc protein [Lentibacillus persicus]|uniref:Cxxc_20_cxxc protein n=2 Tax=Lentibacillus persicus TaxID=640948 RepID=A0A1I1UBK5_9BACI|nr:cxxc_20_cxxc protein [Lentibacillus persicus]